MANDRTATANWKMVLLPPVILMLLFSVDGLQVTSAFSGAKFPLQSYGCLFVDVQLT